MKLRKLLKAISGEAACVVIGEEDEITRHRRTLFIGRCDNVSYWVSDYRVIEVENRKTGWVFKVCDKEET